MQKELIISTTPQETKIAILEDDELVEYYIERHRSQGIVGNIYKGKVTKVLPGMQSAFVDIGLERDAFLYVSDFFDEEEEFERIVMEKTKKGEPNDAAKAAAERVQKARLERERQMEVAQERAEPIAAARIEEIETATPFIAGESNFERIVDDETEGDLFKEARIQERITDHVRAAEFEIEPTPPMAVGSLRLETGGGNLERIADDDDSPTPAETGAAQEKGKRGRGRRGGKKPQSNAPETIVTAPEEIAAPASAEETPKENGG